jgi:structural maintenance of chromosome 1
MSTAQPHGGDANLHAMNGELPFTGGVKFSVIPPGKRYGGIETLSGGEKTLAALALLLAVHSYKPSPFFVFDEVRLRWCHLCLALLALV